MAKKDKKKKDKKKDKKKGKKKGSSTPEVSGSSALFGALKGGSQQSKKGSGASSLFSPAPEPPSSSTQASASAPTSAPTPSPPPKEGAPRPGSGARRTTLGQASDGQYIQVDSRPWNQILADEAHWTPLPFTHGLEIELLIVTETGDYLKGEEMVHRMSEMVKDANGIMTQIIAQERDDFFPNGLFHYMPPYIHSKLGSNPFTKTDIEKGLVMDIRYKVGEGYVDIDCFGRDGNVAAITYILELVTPPCEYAEEMAYWASTLFALAQTTLPKGLFIMATALNPKTVEYQRGLSQGLHSHIGTFQNGVEKAQVYSMLRNFLPHLIALSPNSPIIQNKPTDVIKIRNGRITSPNCVRSLRLKFNNTMLSSNDPKHFIPYLTNVDEQAQQFFLQTIQKASMEDARFQDVFPFTDWGTIELRVMDTQLSICRTIGLAMLVQALCYKARKYLQNQKWVPDPGPEMIVANRMQAIERGLIGVYRTEGTSFEKLAEQDPDFAKFYVGSQDRPIRYMFDAVKNMFYYLKDVLVELGFLYSPFLKPILQSVFGTISYAQPPITEAEYQLSLYDYKKKENPAVEPNLVETLIYYTIEYSKDPLQHPLTGDLTLPPDMFN
ncbi:MAG: hypothetical protein ACTSU5_12595 [Promethearchaeota archaeon]